MKDWKEFEKMSSAELERAAADLPVPDGLERRLTALVDGLDKGEKVLGIGSGGRDEKLSGKGSGRMRPNIRLALGGAAAAVAVVAAGLSMRTPALKDTYEDPALAYAEVERALELFASKMQYGSDKLSESCDRIGQSFETVLK